MKRILVVVDHKGSAKVLITKAMSFSPEYVHLVVFEENNTDIVQVFTEEVESIVDAIVGRKCKIKITTDTVNTDKEKTQRIMALIEETPVDSVIVRRTKILDENHVFEFEKGLLKSLKHTSLLLLSDKNWNDELNILGTLDIVDDNAQQSDLNTLVFDETAFIASKLHAQLHLMSVIAVSSVATELDIVETSEVLAKKGKAVKTKLSDYVSAKNPEHDFLIHVTAGVPSKEIPSVAKKVKADLVVLGNVGRTGLKGLIMGNTAEKILQRLAVDVLLVKQ